MPTLDLLAEGATQEAIIRGLTAAGDVIRRSGMSTDFVQAGRLAVEEHHAGRVRLPQGSWHWIALRVFEEAQRAALDACFAGCAPSAGSRLLIVESKGPASFLD